MTAELDWYLLLNTITIPYKVFSPIGNTCERGDKIFKAYTLVVTYKTSVPENIKTGPTYYRKFKPSNYNLISEPLVPRTFSIYSYTN